MQYYPEKNFVSRENTQRCAILYTFTFSVRGFIMEKNKIVRDLTQGNVTKTMIDFAMPLFFSSLLVTLYNVVDMIVIGRVEGKDGLSAVTIGTEILHFLYFVGMGFSNAGQVIVAQLTGAGEKARVSRMIGTLLTFHFITAAFLAGLSLIFSEHFLTWMNTPEENRAEAASYVRICLYGMISTYGYNSISAILRGLGDSRHPLIFVAISTILNVILDLIFICWWKMGAAGAALATVISQTVSFTWAFAFLYRCRDHFGFDFKLRSFRMTSDSLKPLMKLGIPMVFQSAAISFSMLLIGKWINIYKSTAIAVTGIGNKISLIVNVVNVSFGTAAGSMIGQCIGAKKYDRVPKILGVSLKINGAISFVMAVIMILAPRWVFGLFTSDTDVLDLAMTYIPVALLLFLGSALRSPMMGLINGSGNYILNFTVAVLDGLIIRIGISWVLGFMIGMGVYGFWYGNAIAGLMPFFIGGIYYLTGAWRTRKYILMKKERNRI